MKIETEERDVYKASSIISYELNKCQVQICCQTEIWSVLLGQSKKPPAPPPTSSSV